MVRLLLDVVMQVAWSWTTFDDPPSRQGQIRAASSSAGFIHISEYSSDSQHENYMH
jgi:hypothetical protein